MKCPNCGYLIGDNDTICKGCGNSVVYLKSLNQSKKNDTLKNQKKVESNSSKLDNESERLLNKTADKNDNIDQSKISTFSLLNNKQDVFQEKQEPATTIETEEEKLDRYLAVYIGPNYNKIKKGKFSFASFFLSQFYWAYRNDMKKAIKLIIIQYIVNYFQIILLCIFMLFSSNNTILEFYFSATIYASALKFWGNLAIIIYIFAISLNYNKNLISRAKQKIQELKSTHNGTDEELIKKIKEAGKPDDFSIVKVFAINLAISLIINFLTKIM